MSRKKYTTDNSHLIKFIKANDINPHRNLGLKEDYDVLNCVRNKERCPLSNTLIFCFVTISGNQTGMILTSGGTDQRSGLRTH